MSVLVSVPVYVCLFACGNRVLSGVLVSAFLCGHGECMDHFHRQIHNHTYKKDRETIYTRHTKATKKTFEPWSHTVLMNKLPVLECEIVFSLGAFVCVCVCVARNCICFNGAVYPPPPVAMIYFMQAMEIRMENRKQQ